VHRRATSLAPSWARDVAPGPGLALIHAYNTRDLDVWQRYLAEGLVTIYPGLRGRGIAAARAYNALLLTTFSDLQFRVLSSVTARDRITTTWCFTGTHDGDLVTAGVVTPPTFRSARIEGATVVTVEAGVIVQEEAYWDRLDLMLQLGVALTSRPAR
jgi:hypothetical protein